MRPSIVLGLLLAAAWPHSLPSQAVAADALPNATELLDHSIAYHDPQGRLLNERHRLWFLETRPDATSRRSEVLIDVPSQHFEMLRSGEHDVAGVLSEGHCEMTLDGRSDVTPAEREEHRLSCDRLQTMRNYYTYLWGLPMKLRDPGTQLGRVTRTEFEGRPAYDLRVTYQEAVGKDVWYFYFDPATYALVGYRFYHDEENNDGEVILLEGEVNSQGLRLPKRRTWITHQDSKLLGTDILLAIGGPTRAPIDNGFNRQVFDQWTQMRLGGQGPDGGPVYWYSVGEVYDFPSGDLLMTMEGFDTARSFRSAEEDDVVYQLSRKTYIYRDAETGEILREWKDGKRSLPVEPIEYRYQLIEYALKDGFIETWVEQRSGEQLTRIGPGRDLRARKVPGGTMFSAPVILDLDLPGGRKYQAAEHYDFIASDDSAASDFRISWVRYGDRPSFSGPGKALTHLVSWRVDRFEDLPKGIRDYVNQEAPLWRMPPADLEEIRQLQLGGD